MTVCPPRPQAIAGQFVAGQLAVGTVTYEDAICGVPLCGRAICGTWWAYLCPTGLELGGSLPQVIVVEGQTVIVPPAGLRLGAHIPDHVSISPTAEPDPAGLELGATAPVLQVSSTIAAPQAGLALGAHTPQHAGQRYMEQDTCTDIDLPADSEGDLVLVGAASTTLALEPQECR